MREKRTRITRRTLEWSSMCDHDNCKHFLHKDSVVVAVLTPKAPVAYTAICPSCYKKHYKDDPYYKQIVVQLLYF